MTGQDIDVSGTMDPGKTRTAFTLVELLVVIGIIAVLIAILMPALARARQEALLVDCESNLRQCLIGFQSYASDYQNYICVYSEHDGTYTDWPCWMVQNNNPAVWQTGQTSDPTHCYIPYSVIVCPANLYYADDLSVDATGTVNTHIAYAIRTGGMWAGSRFQFPVTYDGKNFWSYTSTWFSYMQNLNQLGCGTNAGNFTYTDPTRTVFMADSASAYPSTQLFGHNYAEFLDTGPVGYDGEICTVHFNTTANVGFYDGHVESMTAKEICAQTDSHPKYFLDGNMKASVLTYP
jgi:prepilin-type N-terminal cleavage/methylation domain-containing protein/prepilin-type processing-associated H-X9-DG protein